MRSENTAQKLPVLLQLSLSIFAKYVQLNLCTIAMDVYGQQGSLVQPTYF